MQEILLTLMPEQARAQGYIPLDEAAKRPNAPNRATLWRQVTAKKKPGCLVGKGSRPVYWILEASLGSNVSNSSEKTYEQQVESWVEQMESGAFSGKPLSTGYTSTLKWGLKFYWKNLGEQPSISGINAENFRAVMHCAALRVDEVRRVDHYSIKMHMYKGCTRFIDYLIRQGLKTPNDRDAFRDKDVVPKRRYKPQKGVMSESEIREAIAFNRTWYDGRSQYDVEMLDVLLHLYAFAGIRKMEAAWLKLSDINFDTKLMLVFGKGSKERFVPLNLFTELESCLRSWIQNSRPTSDSDFLLVQEDGSLLTESSIRQRLSRISTAMRVDKAYKKLVQSKEWRPGELKEAQTALKAEAKKLAKKIKFAVRAHDLRRSFATIQANKGRPLPQLQLILGHEKIETTMGYVMMDIRHVMDWTAENGGIVESNAGIEKPQLSRRDQLKTILDQGKTGIMRA